MQTILQNIFLFVPKHNISFAFMERETVATWLKEHERTLYWLSAKTGINYNTLYSWYKKESFNLSDQKVKQLKKVIK